MRREGATSYADDVTGRRREASRAPEGRAVGIERDDLEPAERGLLAGVSSCRREAACDRAVLRPARIHVSQ